MIKHPTSWTTVDFKETRIKELFPQESRVLEQVDTLECVTTKSNIVTSTLEWQEVHLRTRIKGIIVTESKRAHLLPWEQKKAPQPLISLQHPRQLALHKRCLLLIDWSKFSRYSRRLGKVFTLNLLGVPAHVTSAIQSVPSLSQTSWSWRTKGHRCLKAFSSSSIILRMIIFHLSYLVAKTSRAGLHKTSSTRTNCSM